MRKSYKSKRRFSRPRPTRKKSSIKRLIRTEIARQAENKIHDTELTDVPFSQAINQTYIRQLIPPLQQGTTQASRIGNKIRVKRFDFRMSLTIANLGANASPTYVDIYIFKYKAAQNWTGLIPAADLSSFLQNGSSSEQYNGGILDGLRYLNNDLFTSCIHKRILMFNPITSQSTAGATASINPNRTIKFDLTKHVKKSLAFDDNFSSCTNDNLWIAVASTQANGAFFFTDVGSYSGIVQMSYEDM